MAMPTKHATLVGFALLASTWVHTGTARSCKCLPLQNMEAEFEESVAVFLGEVVGVEVVEDGPFVSRHIYFNVLQSWKGVRSTSACVSTPSLEMLCGLFPDIGQQLVVFTEGGLPPGFATSCSRTGAFPASGEVDRLERIGYEPLELDAPGPGNFDSDAFLERPDYREVIGCLTGPCSSKTCGLTLFLDPCCAIADSDGDGDVDLRDVGAFHLAFPLGKP